MRINLGCEAAKHSGRKGLEKLPMPGVNLMHDFEIPLPYSDNSVDFVMISNCLQYASDLDRLVQELYRVCRHGAIINITAPYAHASAHLANPYFRQQLSEHTPRYWTPHPVCYVDPDEYRFAAEKNWSLSPYTTNFAGASTVGEEKQRMPHDPIPPGLAADSDAAVPDLRLIRLEFFYYPQYEGLYEPNELSLLRQSQMNIAHHFMMHLIVIKHLISEDEMQWLAAQPMEEPPYVADLRFPVFNNGDEPFLYPGPTGLLLDDNAGKTKPPAASAASPAPPKHIWPETEEESSVNRSNSKKRSASTPGKTRSKAAGAKTTKQGTGTKRSKPAKRQGRS